MPVLFISMVSQTSSKKMKHFSDVTSFVSTHSFVINVDLCSFSLYKLFGMPTSVGGLIIKRSLVRDYELNYFGGGSVRGWLPTEDYLRRDPVEQFSLGTEPYLEYASALIGLKTWLNLTSGIDHLEKWVNRLTTYTLDKMRQLKMFIIYRQPDLSYGPIIAFNVMRDSGDFYRPGDVFRLLESENIQIRSGCFCNIGACMSDLGLDAGSIRHNFENGHACGDEIDLDREGRPQNALRVSFGYHNSFDDVDRFIKVFEEMAIKTDNFDQVNNNQANLTIKSLAVYPIKSCGALSIEQLNITDGLPALDRIYAVATVKTNRILESKRNPRLSLINVSMDKDNLLCIDDTEKLIPIECNSESNSDVYDSTCKSRLCLRKVDLGKVDNEMVNSILSRVLDEPVHLLKIKQSTDGLTLQMKSPLLVVCTASLQWLSDILLRETGTLYRLFVFHNMFLIFLVVLKNWPHDFDLISSSRQRQSLPKNYGQESESEMKCTLLMENAPAVEQFVPIR